MGGHGGLNILPQKRWNVYNYENREKVRRDEEEAAKEEQLKREQARKRDSQFRLQQLRAAKGLTPPLVKAKEPVELLEEEEGAESKCGHINLFEGIKIFDPIKVLENEGDGSKKKKMKREEVKPKIVSAEDEKYRLGYGVAGKGVKLPWYLQKPSDDDNGDGGGDDDDHGKDEKKNTGKKSLEELREERLKRERLEKERERALMQQKRQRDRDVSRNRRFSR